MIALPNKARGLFSYLVLAFAILAILRIANVWVGFAGASAQQVAPQQVISLQESEISNDEIAVAAQASSAVSTQVSSMSDAERRILERLASRRAALDLRESELRVREDLLAAAEHRIDQKIDEYEKTRLALLAAQQMQNDAINDDIDALVSAYERMKPKDAAVIFNELETDILIKVASGMRTQALAGVLAEMAPENARLLTRYLAERNQVASNDADTMIP